MSLLLVLITVYDVTLRYFFKSGSIAVQELEWHLFAVIFLVSMGYTLAADEHVRVDIFYGKMSRRGKAIVNVLGCLFFLIPFCILGVWASAPFVENAFTIAEISPDPGGLPHRFIIKAAIPLGFFFLGLQALAMLFREILVFREKWKEEP